MLSWLNSANHNNQNAGPSPFGCPATHENSPNGETQQKETIISKIKMVGKVLENLKVKLAVEKELLAKEKMGVDCFIYNPKTDYTSGGYVYIPQTNNVSNPLWDDNFTWLTDKGPESFNPIAPDPPTLLTPEKYKAYIHKVEKLCQEEYNNVKQSISNIKRSVRDDYIKNEEIANDTGSNRHSHRKHGNHHSHCCSKKHHQRKSSNKSYQVDLDKDGVFPDRHHYANQGKTESLQDINVNNNPAYMREVNSDFNDIEEALQKINQKFKTQT